MRSLRTPEGRADPYPAYAALHEAGPVIVLNKRVTVAVGYDAVGEMLRDPRLLLDGTVSLDRYVRNWRDHPSMVMMANSLHSVNPPDHTRVRRLMANAFTARRVAWLQDGVAAHAEELIDGLADAGKDGATVDYMSAFAFQFPLRTFCTMLGLPQSDGAWLKPRWEQLVAVQEMDFNALAPADQATEELAEYFSARVAERRDNPGDDMISALAVAQAQAAGGDEEVSEDELIANLVLLLMAGWETVANMLGNGLVILLGEPEHAARLRDDDDVATAYVEEILRMESPIQWTLRWVEDDAEVAGAEIKANSHIQLMLGAANRDPARFADPDRFDPDRPNNHPLAFGAGPHICLGAALGRIIGRTVLPMLLRRLPGLALAGEPTRMDRPAQRGFESVPVTVGTPS